MQVVMDLRAGMAVEHHPSDGGGRAWLESGDEATSLQVGTWTIAYEAGPLGIAEGGGVLLQISPFWGWSTPQTENPAGLGYTTVSSEAAGIELVAATLDRQLLGIRIKGRALREGEQIRIRYGAGARGALADKYAERGSRFWIRVDGDGDGVNKVLVDSPSVDVAPGPPFRLLMTLPTTARKGETVELALAVLDRMANTGLRVEGTVSFKAEEGLDLPEEVALVPEDAGRKRVQVRIEEERVYRLEATVRLKDGELEGRSNPMVVIENGPRIRWGDLHGHSNYSDGTGIPEDYFVYARDVSALDVVSLTDHDHWGVLALDEYPRLWEDIKRVSNDFHEPGKFVTLVGYEWTSWIYGHRHVLYFSDDGDLISSLDETTEHPRDLWRALRGLDVLTIAHHSAGGPIATDWSIPPDPVLEPVTEVVSAHGSSEAGDSPKMIYSALRGNFVRDALDRGYRFGFLGSGDGHDGHPGMTHLSPEYPTGGLAAILTNDLTRAGILEALRNRRVYATSGPRIFMRCALGGRPMGSIVKAEDVGAEEELFLSVIGTSPILRIDLIRSGEVVDVLPGNGDSEMVLSASLSGLERGEYVYVRVVQVDHRDGGDGGMAWSSPVFID